MRSGTEPLILQGSFSEDSRGIFSKPFPLASQYDFDFVVEEIFWSTSSLGVIRGMHFQLEPDEIAKIVWVSHGSIYDVLIDLRDGDSYGAVSTYPLDALSGQSLYVPAGFAHGYQALEDMSIVSYAVDGVFSPQSDAGVRWDSLGIDWPLPVTEISERDKVHPALADFTARFRKPAL
ncbi:dTDP-4-dehydrorhamnose 3,5-epimerase [Lacisediminihabitans sp.]|jgi:dTDP-4-dehydrorhamnose 3,5-epimerase|uniref:dTDP-4-dehydrorhamnose 3,5-epimerase family protein n=1 Tax=Lacisediminihabitans sp. TaxID=2787631 RepID=UPI002F95C433